MLEVAHCLKCQQKGAVGIYLLISVDGTDYVQCVHCGERVRMAVA